MARQEGEKWRADVMVNGKRKSKICATKEEAEKTEKEIKKQLIDGKP